MNDVIRLDELGICAVGLCSNKATDRQVEMIVSFAQQVADNRCVLFPDKDEEGKAGFQELLWGLSEHGLDVSLASTFTDASQPEDLACWPCR